MGLFSPIKKIFTSEEEREEARRLRAERQASRDARKSNRNAVMMDEEPGDITPRVDRGDSNLSGYDPEKLERYLNSGIFANRVAAMRGLQEGITDQQLLEQKQLEAILAYAQQMQAMRRGVAGGQNAEPMRPRAMTQTSPYRRY